MKLNFILRFSIMAIRALARLHAPLSPTGFTPWFRLNVSQPTSTSTPSFPPSPTQPGTALFCFTYYRVQTGDTCALIAAKMNHTFTLEEFYRLNPTVGSNCESLWLGYWVCVNGITMKGLVASAVDSTMTPKARGSFTRSSRFVPTGHVSSAQPRGTAVSFAPLRSTTETEFETRTTTLVTVIVV
ncbi:hypothetical protein P152DRAFT_110850 [Eremomyces bilateralis CBS 781.70]|uniref:LysM domain-containing protein n=1 Tax=Eremomyces bilateralis CBS 781.70 TaxID=1392243 RepID=A0A6G1GDJ8_9PEZI|nr:uncharacterized protein P152DRAFT_110850 [Eremomyces bilateralis CBS 781.70]KAF1816113.1 hypothetical protein P152DRAFT_110850 [Eremomyces bilateralis CBS 781.70]